MNESILFKHFYFCNDDKQESKPIASANSEGIVIEKITQRTVVDSIQTGTRWWKTSQRRPCPGDAYETSSAFKKVFSRILGAVEPPIRNTQNENWKDEKAF